MSAQAEHVLCVQCGITTYPHSRCRCSACGDYHAHHLGCRRVRFCPQCCQTVSIHTICNCLHCGRRHQKSQVCRSRPATPAFRAAMRGVTPERLDIGDMSHVCPFCGARSWHSERAINCCASAEIQLAAFPVPPPALSAARLHDCYHHPAAKPGLRKEIPPM